MTGPAGQPLPRRWGDFLFQLGLWLGFAGVYQLVRGVADRSAFEALANGSLVIDAERALHLLIEPDLQRVVLQAGIFLELVNWTYWLSQFAVVSLALLWIYFARNEEFPRARNWILLTNVLALAGYALMPTAPPRMFSEYGFVDTLAAETALNHGSGIIQLASNQFAAMPSVHAADALVIGFVLATLVRSRPLKLFWTFWPGWVWFAVMATGNHYWLDVAAGIGTAVLAGAMLSWIESRGWPELALLRNRR